MKRTAIMLAALGAALAATAAPAVEYQIRRGEPRPKLPELDFWPQPKRSRLWRPEPPPLPKEHAAAKRSRDLKAQKRKARQARAKR